MRNIISITNHPSLDGVTRKAQVVETHNKYAETNIVMTLKITHFIDGVEQTYFPKTVYLRASNDNLVDANGAYVDATAEFHIGEYDYLWNIVNIAKEHTQCELEEIYVGLRIAEINEQLYK